jgi:hypothetical protein
MNRKPAQRTRKSTVNSRKTTVNSRIPGRCYRSFGQNEAIFRRKVNRRNNLPKARGLCICKGSLVKELQLNSAVARGSSFRKLRPQNSLHQSPDISYGAEVLQDITIEAAMYRAIGLLQTNNDFSIPAAAERLRQALPRHSVVVSGSRIRVEQGDWWIALELVSGPQLRNETEGLVGKLAGLEPAEAEAFVSSLQRVEVWTDLPDPVMEHFDDYQSVVGVLKSFRGLLAVDPKEPGVL